MNISETAKKIIFQSTHSLSFNVIHFFSRFLLIYTLGKTFLPEDYGAYGLINTFIGIAGYFLGFEIYTYLYKEIPGKSEEEQYSIFKSIIIPKSAISIVSLGIFLIFGLQNLFIEKLNLQKVYFAFILGLMFIAIETIGSEIPRFFTARKKIEITNYLEFLKKALWIYIVFILFLLGRRINVVHIFILITVASFITSFLGLYLLNIKKIINAKFNSSLFKNAVKFSIPMWIGSVSMLLIDMSDRYILAYYKGLNDVGIFTYFYALVNTIFVMSADILIGVSFPYIMEYHNCKEYEKRNKLFNRTIKYGAIIFFLVGGTFVIFSKPMLHLISRREYFTGIQLIPLYLLIYLILAISYHGHYLMFIEGKSVLLSLCNIAGLLSSVVFNVLLIPKYSYYGAAISHIISLSVIAILKIGLSKSWKLIRLCELLSFKQETEIFRLYLKKVKEMIV